MLSLHSLEKIVFYWLETTIPAGRVRSGRVGWLDNLEIMLNSVQLSWKMTELGKKKCSRFSKINFIKKLFVLKEMPII